MKNLFQRIGVILLLAGSMSVCFSGMSMAQLTISKIIISPPKTEIAVGSGKIVLTVKASGGKNLKFEWELQGQGRLEEPTTKSAVFYIPPETINGTSEQAIISIKVTADGGEEATDNVLLTITNAAIPPRITPTTTPDITPTPGSFTEYPDFLEPTDCSYLKADGEMIAFYKSGWPQSTWRSWGHIITALRLAKEQKSSEVFIHGIRTDRQDFVRFRVEKGAPLYEVGGTLDAKIEIGPCWKKVKELPKRSFTWQGENITVKSEIIYLLMQQ